MNEQDCGPLASHTTCHEAERTVDHLSDQGFPVERVAIIGQDASGRAGDRPHGTWRGERRADRVDSRLLNWPAPVVSGLLLALYGLVFGAHFGALLGPPVYAAQRGRRDFTSVGFIEPCRYDDVTDEAVRLLAQPPSRTGTITGSGAWQSSRPHNGPAVN